MRRGWWKKWISVALILEMMGGVFAATGALSVAPLEDAAPIRVNCEAALLMEASSGQIIFEVNADAQRPVASVTKIMTILLTIEAIESGRASLEDSVVISRNASGMGGSQVLLDTGEVQTLDILLKSTIVGSANDASVAIAEHLYGSESLFVDEMNRRAKALQMEDTHFVNCTGLPTTGQYTTARDVARMATELYSHDLYYTFSTLWMDKVDHHDGRLTDLTNTNRLIRLYDGCDGGKTGSTNEAGYCIVATAKRSDMRLIAVVLGASTGKIRFSSAQAMFDYGFANYRLYEVAKRGTRVRGELPVQGGDADTVALALDGDLTLLMNKSDAVTIDLKPHLPNSVSAPIAVGAVVGNVDIVLNERTIAQIPVAAVHAVNRRGFFDAWQRIVSGWFFGN